MSPDLPMVLKMPICLATICMRILLSMLSMHEACPQVGVVFKRHYRNVNVLDTLSFQLEGMCNKDNA